MKYNRFISFILIFVLSFNMFSVSSFAAPGDPGEWTWQQNGIYFFANLADLIPSVIGLVTGGDVSSELISNFEDLLYQYIVNDELSYEEYVGQRVTYDFPDNKPITDNSVPTSITIEPVILNLMQEAADKTIEDNPNGYSIQTIYSYKKMAAEYFPSATVYNTYMNYIKTLPDNVKYIISPEYNRKVNNFTNCDPAGHWQLSSKALVWTDRTIDFVSNSGHLNNYVYNNNFTFYHNWQDITPLYNSSSYAKVYEGWSGRCFNANGEVLDVVSYDRPSNIGAFYNSNYTFNSTSMSAIFTTSDHDVTVRLYDSPESLIRFDSGNPAPYYYTSDYKGTGYVFTSSESINSSDMVDNSSVYSNVVNQVTTGMSEEAVIELVDTIMKNNSGGGSGSGGGSDSDDKDKESLWDKIKDGVVGFFEELAEVIKEIVSLIVDVLLGALRELLGAVKDILTEMVDFFIGEKDDVTGIRQDNGFVSLMTAFFDWLPAPLPLVIKSVFIIAIVFALIKMVKGFAS